MVANPYTVAHDIAASLVESARPFMAEVVALNAPLVEIRSIHNPTSLGLAETTPEVIAAAAPGDRGLAVATDGGFFLLCLVAV